jgi:peptidoglycan/xylan/chitin deacetylase (PgdA/CDA1 family)
MSSGRFERPFACFTFDDGYKDNLRYAYPIFERHQAPMAVYIPTDYPDGKGDLWWIALEKAIECADSIEMTIAGRRQSLSVSTTARKHEAFKIVYRWLRSIDEPSARAAVAELCASVGYDTSDLCRSTIMSWDDIRTLASDPLVTIGAHTRRHLALAGLSYSDACSEISESVRRIEREIGQRPAHFSFPYGCGRSAGSREFTLAREFGLKTAVTTRKGLLFSDHARQMTGLPRISLNGLYQQPRYLSVLMSGVPTYLWNGLRRIAA